MEKILYVSDLDGTLLNEEKTLSEYTLQTLNALIDKGLCFTYATARSLTSAREVTRGLQLKLPVIVYNGAFIQEADSGKTVLSRQFSDQEKEEILSLHLLHGIYPRVYALKEGKERFSYVKERLSRGTAAYLAKRVSDKRANPTSEDRLLDGEVFCFSSIDERDRLLSIYHALKDKYHTLLYQDPYTGEYWLEVLPSFATKADAILALKKRYGFESVVVFGDETNDLSMFAAADESYAVAGANDEVKRAASGVIGSNACDGVAKFLHTFYP